MDAPVTRRAADATRPAPGPVADAPLGNVPTAW